ncbi:hypothetical protein NQ318_003610 [Aromia moschata]|uniref:DUF659 domain-containing protein n=1 Tax=Aromia moschata TaxID=1265417 RepID=A0AAV8Y460_9CUCU|nr:hypothetical protein NQ318_003610 [Aromia moschata]
MGLSASGLKLCQHGKLCMYSLLESPSKMHEPGISRINTAPNAVTKRQYIRKYISTARENINKIKSILKNARIWLCIDETTYLKEQSFLNIIVRVLDPLKPTCPLLLASQRQTECTGETLTRVVLETLQKFELSRSQVLMFVTDGAATICVVSRSHQEHGCNMIHVTCKVHALHLVAETIRQYSQRQMH